MSPETTQETMLGPYALQQEIGSGGMGTVYLARRADGVFNKNVAVKIARLSLGSQDREKRFRKERQILAKIEHAGIARLIDGGTTDRGEPYLVMDHVDGLPLDKHCDEKRLSVEERVALLAEICDIVEHAHQMGVVHRDIKPQNILVTKKGEPKLLDFGIARLLEPEDFSVTVMATETARPLMTPHFASPEQVTGEPVNATSDVYSLGVLLYLLLTGRLPFNLSHLTLFEMQRMLLVKDPTRPSQAAADAKIEKAEKRGLRPSELRQRLSGELDRIILKAIHREPERRYPSAAAFAADLRAHLAGEAVVARSDSLSYRAWHLLKPYRLNVVMALALAILLVLLMSRPLSTPRSVSAEPATPSIAPEGTPISTILPASQISPVGQEAFENGVQALQQRDGEGARQAFEAALADNQDFALARAGLSEALTILGLDKAAAVEAAEAYEQVDRLPRQQAIWVEALYHETAQQWDAAERAYSALWTFFPDNVEHGIRLCTVQLRGERYSDALKTLARLRQLPNDGPVDPRFDLLEGKATFHLDRYEPALPFADRAVAQAQSQQINGLLAESLHLRAWIHFRLRDYPSAEADFLGATDLLTAMGEGPEPLRALNGLAVVQTMQKRYAEAEKSYRRGIEIHGKLGAEQQQAGLQLNLSSILTNTGKYSDGLELARIGRETFRKFKNMGATAASYELEGKHALAIGDLAAAANAYRMLLELTKSMDTPMRTQEGIAHLGLSDVARQRAHFAEARRHYQLALEICQEKETQRICRNQQWTSARLQRDQGNPDQSEAMYQAILTRALQENEKITAARANVQLARLAAEGNKPLEALERTETNIQVLESHGLSDKAGIGRAARLQATVLLGQSDPSLAELLRQQLTTTESIDLRFTGGLALARYEAAAGDLDAAQRQIEEIRREATDSEFLAVAEEAAKLATELGLSD